MRYTVLTYCFGNYERIHEIKEKDPDAEYILITDDVMAESNTWTLVWAHTDDSMTVWEKCYDVRFHPFDYAQSDIVVRLDGSIGINRSLKPIIDEFERRQADRCLMIHPSRSMIPTEYEAWCRERKYPKDQAADMLHIMQRMGYDLNQKGLFQAGFEVVRKNRTNQLINDITFDLLKYAAADGHIQRINQTWLSMVINHLFSDRLKVMPVSQNIITDGDLMQWYLHNSDTPIKNPAKIAPIMFGKKTDVWR